MQHHHFTEEPQIGTVYSSKQMLTNNPPVLITLLSIHDGKARVQGMHCKIGVFEMPNGSKAKAWVDWLGWYK